MSVPETAISLDVSTLFVIATCVSALLGLLLLAIWKQERIRALAWWGAAYLLGGVSVALWALGGHGSIVPSPLPSAMLFLACGMIWSAARLFHGRPVLWISMWAGAFAWLAACAIPTVIETASHRVILSSVIISAYTFLTALELWRERRKSLIRRWPALFVPVLHGLVFLAPVPLASLMPEERGLATLAGGWLAVFALEAILYAVGTAFIVVVLSKERSVRLHKTAAFTDVLTGIFNRRAFLDGAEQLKASQQRNGQPVTVLMFDLDHFKSINDEFGHFVGDEALKLFATTISTNLRATDLVARLGGEEFVAMVPGSLAEGITAAERVRLAFEVAGRRLGRHVIGATVSIGAASGPADEETAVLLARADAALYVAKANGRNRIEADIPGLAAPAPARQPGAKDEEPESAADWSVYANVTPYPRRRAVA